MGFGPCLPLDKKGVAIDLFMSTKFVGYVIFTYTSI